MAEGGSADTIEVMAVLDCVKLCTWTKYSGSSRDRKWGMGRSVLILASSRERLMHMVGIVHYIRFSVQLAVASNSLCVEGRE